MNRFNLSFKGEIQPGKNPAQVKVRFGKLFGIDDPQRLERFFSGETIVLRRNLERKTAAEYYSKLRKLGVEAELVMVATQETAAPTPPPPKQPSSRDKPDSIADEKTLNNSTPAIRGMNREVLQRKPGQIDQSWAVSASRTNASTELPRQSAEKTGRKNRAEKARRKAEVKAARRQAAKEETQRKADEKAARQKALEVEARRKADEEAARLKALEVEALRKADEKAARQKALEVETRRKADEEAARQKALEVEARRKAAEEAAKRKAEEAERRKAEREEQRRIKAEEVASRRAAKREARQRAAEETAKRATEKAEQTARKRAEKAQARREAADEAARQKALREEEKRKTAEDATRQKAAQHEAKRKVRENAAQRRVEDRARKVERAARRAAERAETQRKKAEKAASKKTAEAKAKRKAAEDAARRREQLAEQKRLEAEQEVREKARREQARQEKEALDARNKAEQKEVQRLAVAEVARERAQQKQHRADEYKRLKTEKEAQEKREKKAKEEARRLAAARAAKEKAKAEGVRKAEEAERNALEERAIQRAAQELTRQSGLKPVEARVKTRLELPQGKQTAYRDKATRQPGSPNLYKLRPFRNTQEVKTRSTVSRQRMRRQLGIAGTGVACLLLMTGVYLKLPAVMPISSPAGVAISPGLEPLLLAGDRLLSHDRAGVGSGQLTLAELGITRLATTLAFTPTGDLFALGSLATEPSTTDRVLRCHLKTASCSAVPGQKHGFDVRAFAVHPLDESLLLANSREGQLMHLDREGNLLASTALDLPAQPVLRLQSGLLFINSADGPAISVHRYDLQAFGRQLDEILLLPPSAVDAGMNRVRDFLWNSNAWWVTLYAPETGVSAVYRFDSNWDYLGRLPLHKNTRPRQLAAWASKTLVLDSNQILLQRFNALGAAEKPFDSNILRSLADGQQRRRFFTNLGWHSAFIVFGMITLGTAVLAWLQSMRALVYRARAARGAHPIDGLAEQVTWVTPLPDRSKRFRYAITSYAAVALALVLLGIGGGISTMELSALLLALAAFAWGLLLLQRSPIGHIGVVQGQLLLVDHDNMYHLGSDSRLQYRGPFLLIDDVVVFVGNTLLPAFNPHQIQAQITSLATSGVRVDRKTVLIKLLQGAHPIVKSGIVALAGGLLAGTLLALQWW